MNRPGTPTVVHLERVIAAPPHAVYRAWLDPDLLRQWMAPGELGVSRVEVDERVGGHLRIWQVAGGRPVGGFESEILELEPDRRLVLRWGFVGPDRAAGPTFDSLLTVILFEAADGATRLDLRHERLESLGWAMPEVAGQVGPGWESALDHLVDALAPRGPDAD